MINTYEGVLVELSKGKVEFLLVGGLAVDLSGFSRSTFDVDILVEDSADNLSRMLAVLLAFGEGSAKELSVSDFTREEGAIQVAESFPLDIFTVMNGKLYADLLPYSKVYTATDVEIRYLGAEGLILLKRGSLRPKDRLDVEMLKKILEEE